MPTITLGVVNSKDYGGPNFISDSVFGGTAVGVPVDGSLDNTVLADSSDTTYYQILGSNGADISRGFQSEILIDLVPSSAYVNAVTFNLRARLGTQPPNNPCLSYPFTEVWGRLGAPSTGYFYGNRSLTVDFANYTFPLPVAPNGADWDSVPIAFGIMELLRVGLRGRTDCPGIGALPVDWAEASLTLGLTMPPTVTTGAATSVGVGAAELQGTVNAFQDPLPSGLPCTLFPVTWQFMFGLEPTNLDEVGNPDGYIIGNENHPVTFQVTGLSALTTYYFRLKAFCGGEVFLGAVSTFKTPSTDPSFGVF